MNLIKNDPCHMPLEQFEGMTLSEFIKHVREIYPFASIDFGGGGNIIINTGLSFYNGLQKANITIQTSLYADDSNYEKDGEERLKIMFNNDKKN